MHLVFLDRIMHFCIVSIETGLPLSQISIKERNSFPGLGCSKLTTLFVNFFLKFQMFISEIRQYFCEKMSDRSFCSATASLIIPTKNISVFGY